MLALILWIGGVVVDGVVFVVVDVVVVVNDFDEAAGVWEQGANPDENRLFYDNGSECMQRPRWRQ